MPLETYFVFAPPFFISPTRTRREMIASYSMFKYRQLSDHLGCLLWTNPIIDFTIQILALIRLDYSRK